jgi:hypothetical protein
MSRPGLTSAVLDLSRQKPVNRPRECRQFSHSRKPVRDALIFRQSRALSNSPEIRRSEHLPMSHIAEVTHSRGLIWDQISVESSGGLNPLVIPGLPKGQARHFVERVRERLNETGAIPLEQPSSIKK